MFTLPIPEPEGNLFESTLEPHLLSLARIRSDTGTGEGDIQTLRGKKNKVAVGLPYYENLTSRIQNLNEEIPYEIRRLTDEFDFHYTRFACSFLPDHDCRFEWARFGIDLVSENSKSDQPKPISWDITPSEILTPVKYKREISFSPELKFSIIPEIVDAGISGAFNESKEYVVYEPQITSFGLNRSNVIWQFKSTKQQGIFGNKTLLVIIKAPKDSKVKGKFLIGAEVSSRLSKWMPFPVRNSDDRIVSVEYSLSK